MTGTSRAANCPQWALRIYDGLAVVMLAFAVFALVWDDGNTARETGVRARDWWDLGAAALLPATLLVSLWLGRRRSNETDEYLRRLIGHSAAVGVLVTVVAWSSWTMLAQSWVAPPFGGQLIGLLIGSCALAYGAARIRDAF